MKLNTTSVAEIERDGIVDESHFKIAATSKAFKILSDGLYSDKVGSVIRELSCNAIDSHVEAGVASRPIEVHLPTMLEPYFRVTDFGVGLDHRQVMDIYTTYFSSTKTNSNAFIGQLGLGSKSPFSYCRAFTVIAVKDGMKCSYSMHYDERDIPQVSLLGTEKVSEPNGVQVELPVRREHFQEFAQKASLVYRWFPVKPIITGNTEISIKSADDIQFSGTGWKIIKQAQNNRYYHDYDAIKATAVMGKVGYEINASALTDLDDDLRNVLGLPLVIDFKIGDLEVAASRESLGYDNRTIDKIKHKLRLVIEELVIEFEKKIAAATTEWEARRAFGEVFSSYEYGFYNNFRHIFSKTGLNWKGKKLDGDSVSIETSLLWDEHMSPLFSTLDDYQKRVRTTKHHCYFSLRCDNKGLILFNDMEHGGLSRIHYYRESQMKAHTFKNLYVFGPSKLKTVKEILNMLGNPTNYKMVSSLPKRPPADKADKVDMLSYSGYSRNAKSASWQSEKDVEIEDGGVYVMLDGWKVVKDDKEMTMFNDIISLARATGCISKSEPIYAPRGVFKRKIVKHTEWVSLWDKIKDEVSSKMNVGTLQARADIKEFESVSNINRKIWETQWKLKDPNSPLLTFSTAMKTLAKTINTTKLDQNLIRLSNLMGMDTNLKIPAPSVEVRTLSEAVKKQYSILELVIGQYSSYSFSQTVPVIQEYIDIVDAYKASNP